MNSKIKKIKNIKVILKTMIYKNSVWNAAIENKYKLYKMINKKKSKFYEIEISKHH